MTVPFKEILGTLRRPGVYGELNTRLAKQGLPQNQQKMIILGQRLKAVIEPEIWQGGTLDDMGNSGTFTGAVVKKYRIKISTAAATDKFKWSGDDGLIWSAEISLTGSAQLLELGVSVTFTAVTGHALNDEWRFNAYPEPTVAEKVATAVFSDAEPETYFGYGSLCSLGVQAALACQRYIDLSVIALDDNVAGVAATGTSTYTVTAIANGSLRRYFGSQYVDIAINSGDTPTIIATKTCNAVAAKPSLPVTAKNVAGVVTYTAKNKGLCGNDIHLAYEMTGTPGITIVDVAMASGATNPSIQDALTPIFGTRYHVIVTPFNNSTDVQILRTHLNSVSDGMARRPGTAVYGMTGAMADATTLAGLTESGRLQNQWLRYTSATKRQYHPFELACAKAALLASQSDPAMPFDDEELVGVPVPTIADRIAPDTEGESCLWNGVSPTVVGPGETVRVVRSITTYMHNPQGIADPALLDITTIRSLDYVRETLLAGLAAEMPKKKTSTAIATAEDIVYDYLKKLENAEITRDVDTYKDDITFEDDPTDPTRLNGRIPAPVVPGLHIIATMIDLTF